MVCISYKNSSFAVQSQLSYSLHLQRSKFDHITDVIRDELHLLPVRERIDFKLCLQMYKCLHDAAPLYLTRYCHAVSADADRCHLRSAAKDKLIVLRTKSATGVRSFAVAGPSLWNDLKERST